MNTLFTTFPVLLTKQLVLRQLSVNDKEALFELRSDDKVNKFIERNAPKNITEVENFISLIDEHVKSKKGIYWVIEYQKRVIGSIGLRHFNEECTYAEIGYELHSSFHGLGLMSEAFSKVLEYGFFTLNLLEIEAYTHKQNKSSINLLNRYKFQLKKDKVDEHCENNIIFGLLKNEYQ